MHREGHPAAFCQVRGELPGVGGHPPPYQLIFQGVESPCPAYSADISNPAPSCPKRQPRSLSLWAPPPPHRPPPQVGFLLGCLSWLPCTLQPLLSQTADLGQSSQRTPDPSQVLPGPLSFPGLQGAQQANSILPPFPPPAEPPKFSSQWTGPITAPGTGLLRSLGLTHLSCREHSRFCSLEARVSEPT